MGAEARDAGRARQHAQRAGVRAAEGLHDGRGGRPGHGDRPDEALGDVGEQDGLGLRSVIAQIDFAAARRQGDGERLARLHEGLGLGREGLHRAHADEPRAGREGQPARQARPDAQAGVRARPGRDGNGVDLRRLEARVGKRLSHEQREARRVRARHGDARLGEQRAVAHDGDGADVGRGVDAEEGHGGRASGQWPVGQWQRTTEAAKTVERWGTGSWEDARARKAEGGKCRSSHSPLPTPHTTARWPAGRTSTCSASTRGPSICVTSTRSAPASTASPTSGDAADAGDEPARGRPVGALGGRQRDARRVLDLVDRRGAGDRERAVGEAHDAGALAGVGQGADERLEDVVQRHEARRRAILVRHDGDLVARLAEQLEHAQRGRVLGHEADRPHRRGHVQRGAGEELPEQVADVHDALDVVQAVAADDEADVRGRGDGVAERLGAVREVERGDLRPRRHHARHVAVAEAEDALDDAPLLGVDHARLRPLVQQQPDLFLGRRRAVLRRHAEQAQQQVRRAREDEHDRRRDLRDHLHRARDDGRDALGVVQRDPLRHQLADDEREVRDREDDEEDGDAVRGRRDRPDACEDGRERVRELCAAIRAGEDADERDADLHRREEAVRAGRELDRGARAQVAVVGALLQPRLARRDDGELGHREHAVEHDQREDQQGLGRRRGHRGCGASGRSPRLRVRACSVRSRSAARARPRPAAPARAGSGG